MKKLLIIFGSLFMFAWASFARGGAKFKPIVIADQGSFTAGGKSVTHTGEFNPTDDIWNPEGQTAYGDNAFVFYQIPKKAKKLPLVFWHGGGQSMKTWETTCDGREGFQTIFLRRHFKVCLVDQPRRGQAGFSTVPADAPLQPLYIDKTMFTLFRLGYWPNYYEGVQFPRSKEALEQFHRQGTPNTAPPRLYRFGGCRSGAVRKNRRRNSRNAFTGRNGRMENGDTDR